ncbi:MAG: hypothetical protein AAF236_02200 [Verrucomicrobiota bacterium]
MSTAADCRVNCGTPPSGTCQPEDGTIAPTSVSTSFSRDFTDYTNDDGCIYAREGINPTASIEFSAKLLDKTSGLGAMHVGDNISDLGITLNNYSGMCRGFDANTGCIMLEEAGNECSEGEEPTTTMTFTHLPHVTV